MVESKQSGVYAIRNLVNGKRYIGSATRCFRERWRSHRCDLKAGRHHSARLQYSWNKHGESNFVFEVVELCVSGHCIDVEQVLMDFYDATNPDHGYNICKNAGNCVGHKFSDESRAKMSRSQAGKKRTAESISKSAAGNRGKKRSPEVLAAMSERRRGRKMPDGFGEKVSKAKKNPSAETRLRMSESHRGRKQSAETKAKRSATMLAKRRIPESVAKPTESRRGEDSSVA